MKTESVVVIGALLIAAAARAQEARPEVALLSAAHRVGVLEPDRPRADYRFELDAAAEVGFVVTSPLALAVEIGLPDGSTLSARNANGEDRRVSEFRIEEPPDLMLPGVGRGHNTLASLAAPPAGAYEVRVQALDAVVGPVPVAVTMLPVSDVRLGLAIVQPEVVLGGAVAVSVLLFEGERPVAGAAVTATIAREPDDADAAAPKPQAVALHDDGRAPDAEAGDGAYTGLVQPAVEGTYLVLARAEGASAAGLRFERDAGGSFRASGRTARLSGTYEAGLAEEGGGTGLRVRVGLDLPAPGRYEVTVVLRAEDGREAAGQAAADVREEAALDVPFAAETLRALATDGPLAIARVELHELTAADRVLRDAAADVGATPALRTGADGSK